MEKKITRTDVRKAPEYMVLVDYMTTNTPKYYPFRYELLNATDILTAMDEAEAYHDDTVYLIKLMKKTDEVTESGIVYSAILTSRSKGNFHRTDSKHCESGCEATYHPHWDWMPINGYYR